MAGLIETFIGPRVPIEELRRRRFHYLAPGVVLSIARLCLLVSIFLPYWMMELQAPQYPDGLHVEAYVNRLVGDVAEIDGLNHYIGMRPLEDAAQLERTLSIAMLIVLVIAIEGALYIHTKWAALIVLPVIVFPAFFLIDLHFWMHTFGQNLDPAAPLSSSIKPFTPPVLGVGVIGQFKTIASMGPGLLLAWCASLLTIVGLVLHRRAYRPLHDLKEPVTT